MRLKGILALTLLAGVLWACTPTREASIQPAETTPVVTPASQGEDKKMGAPSEQMPEELDSRLENRDKTALPAEALLRFQLINRGKNPGPNYRWLLYEDGRWFLARRSSESTPWEVPFNTDLPAEPTRQLPAEVVNNVKAQLQKAKFFNQAPYQVDNSVKDGGFYVVTAQMEGQTHEVIYVAGSSPLLNFLKGLAAKYE